jgi:hypothetical protein
MTKEEFETKYEVEVEVTNKDNGTDYLVKKDGNQILVCDKSKEDFERLESWWDTIKHKLSINCTTKMNDK